MVFNHLQSGVKVADFEFDDTLYPKAVSDLSFTHFTPVEIAKEAAQYLVNYSGIKVLDIGSGVGKFCMVGTSCTSGYFTGVEQRQHLCDIANAIIEKRELPNIEIIHANILDVDFQDYEAFYFYNSFYENIVPSDRIDDSLLVTSKLYEIYSIYVKQQLDLMPKGTRLATYFSSYDAVPDSYSIISKDDRTKLILWQKSH